MIRRPKRNGLSLGRKLPFQQDRQPRQHDPAPDVRPLRRGSKPAENIRRDPDSSAEYASDKALLGREHHSQSHDQLQEKPAPTATSQGIMFSTILMMIGLTLGKLTSQFREVLYMPVFEERGLADAFILGFQVPDLFYQLLVGGAIQAAVTPSLARALARGQERIFWRSLSIFINVTALAVLLSIGIGEVFAPQLIRYYRGSEAIARLAASVSRVLFPQVLFMMLAALSMGILNGYREFRSTAFGPTFYNLFVILAIVLLGDASEPGVVRVGIGVSVAALLFFLIQFSQARHHFIHYQTSLDLRDRGFRRLVSLAVPTLLSGSIVQLNTIILYSFIQETGMVVAMRNASTTWQLPYGIFVVAIGNVMLPSLAERVGSDDDAGARRLLGSSLRSALFLTIPAAAVFLAMQEDTIRAIFQWNAHYSETMVSDAASILRWYCLALVAQTFVLLYNQAFYARRVTRVALFIGILTLVLNYAFCAALTAWTELGTSSLSLAYTLTSLINALILSRLFRYFYPAGSPRRMTPFLLRCATCTIALLLILVGLSFVPFAPTSKLVQLLWYGARAALGFAVYLAVARLLRMRELEDVLSRFLRRTPSRSA